MTVKKPTKTELYNAEVVKIYKNPYYTLDEAVEKYLEFKSKQTILKKPWDKTLNFARAKILTDFIKKEYKVKSYLEYEAIYQHVLDIENDRLKNKGYIHITEKVWIDHDSENRLKERFNELNPDMVTANGLFAAIMAMPESMKKTAIYKNMMSKLDKIENRQKVKGFEFIARLPVFQQMLEEQYKILIIVNHRYKSNKMYLNFEFVPTGTLEQRDRAKKLLEKAGMNIDEKMCEFGLRERI